MLPLTKKNQGFTLLEMTIVLFIAGILAAISAPSLLGWYRRTQLNNARTEVEGALLQAQQEAIRRSEDCDVTINNTDPVTINSCVSTRTLPDPVAISDDTTITNITFNFRGSTNDNGEIVLESEAVTDDLCLRIFSPLGLIREGVMNDEGECEP